MAEIETIARPYAKAAFQYAIANNELEKWLQMLGALSMVATDPQVERLLTDPRVSSKQLADLFKDVLGESLNQDANNFVDVLADNKRLAAFGAIFIIYQKLYEEQQKKVTAKVFAAQPLTDDQSMRLKQALESRLQRDVELDTIIEPDVYGGIRVQANDLVIDGTIKGRLQRLFENLTD